MASKDSFAEHYYCSDPACVKYTAEVTDAGEAGNEFFNCPVCDKPLRKHVDATLTDTISGSDSS